ncbi:hypothetical protein OAA60_03595, partial [Porticoccaceae bacterium]|nr:hypothetical protein [Porticoccaceae bacterium]
KSHKEEAEEHHYNSDSERKIKDDSFLMLTDITPSIVKKKSKSVPNETIHNITIKDTIENLSPTSRNKV